MGGTAFVHGSHRLSVSARLLSEDDNDHMTGNDDDGTDAKESCHTATKTANPIAIGAQFFAPDFLLIAVSKTTNT